MQQIKIEVPCAGALQGGIKHLTGLLRRLGTGPGGQLGGKLEAFPGIAFHQRGFYSFLGLPVDIAVGCVKIGKARLQEQIHHLLDLLHVDAAVCVFRQPHEPKAQLRDALSQIFVHSLSFLNPFSLLYGAARNAGRG